MDIEKLKEEFIKLKKKELEYLDNISKLSCQKVFSQEEKLNIYRKLKLMVYVIASELTMILRYQH